MTYIGAAKEKRECIFCAALSGDARERLVLGTTGHSLVMLNRYPYQNGHLMVAPRRHVADLPSLPAAEHGDLAETLRRGPASLAHARPPRGIHPGQNPRTRHRARRP